jgi:outer membrane biosynthesis protein TonB
MGGRPRAAPTPRAATILAASACLLALLCAAPGPARAEAPEAPSGVECEGDSCQPLPAPPAEVTPGTATVEGPPDPPVSFPAEAPKHPHRPKHPKHPKPGSHHHPGHHATGKARR